MIAHYARLRDEFTTAQFPAKEHPWGKVIPHCIPLHNDITNSEIPYQGTATKEVVTLSQTADPQTFYCASSRDSWSIRWDRLRADTDRKPTASAGDSRPSGRSRRHNPRAPARVCPTKETVSWVTSRASTEWHLQEFRQAAGRATDRTTATRRGQVGSYHHRCCHREGAVDYHWPELCFQERWWQWEGPSQSPVPLCRTVVQLCRTVVRLCRTVTYEHC